MQHVQRKCGTCKLRRNVLFLEHLYDNQLFGPIAVLISPKTILMEGIDAGVSAGADPTAMRNFLEVSR